MLSTLQRTRSLTVAQPAPAWALVFGLSRGPIWCRPQAPSRRRYCPRRPWRSTQQSVQGAGVGERGRPSRWLHMFLSLGLSRRVFDGPTAALLDNVPKTPELSSPHLSTTCHRRFLALATQPHGTHRRTAKYGPEGLYPRPVASRTCWAGSVCEVCTATFERCPRRTQRAMGSRRKNRVAYHASTRRRCRRPAAVETDAIGPRAA